MNSSSIYADSVDGFLIKSRFCVPRQKRIYKIKRRAVAATTRFGRQIKGECWNERRSLEGFVEIDFN